MSDPSRLKAAAEAFLGGPVLAAGIFGLQDDAVAVTLGGAGATAALETMADPGPLADGAVAAAGIHVARAAHAAAQGLAVRMLVAVTDGTIHVLDYADGTVSREFLRFDRSTAQVHVTRFGASRRIRLEDPQSGEHLEITGSTGLLSSESAADKTVLALLT